jgi:hypothetical protein
LGAGSATDYGMLEVKNGANKLVELGGGASGVAGANGASYLKISKAAALQISVQGESGDITSKALKVGGNVALTANLIVGGTLACSGTLITLNTSDMLVSDAEIQIKSAASNAAQSQDTALYFSASSDNAGKLGGRVCYISGSGLAQCFDFRNQVGSNTAAVADKGVAGNLINVEAKSFVGNGDSLTSVPSMGVTVHAADGTGSLGLNLVNCSSARIIELPDNAVEGHWIRFKKSAGSNSLTIRKNSNDNKQLEDTLDNIVALSDDAAVDLVYVASGKTKWYVL